MAYRNGTYVAFHANGAKEPTESDIKYYNLLCAWNANRDDDFAFINSHTKNGAIRDFSKKQTIEKALKERLRNSKNMLLIIGKTTREDRDWIPMEIEYAVDVCSLPVIAAYPGYQRINAPHLLNTLWPGALLERINDGSARIIHVPFAKEPILDAIGQFDVNNYPKGGGLGIYSESAYRAWGM